MTFNDAVEWAGSQSELSRILGISRQAVSKWKGRLPERHEEELRERMSKDGWAECKVCEEIADIHYDGLCQTCHEDMTR